MRSSILFDRIRLSIVTTLFLYAMTPFEFGSDAQTTLLLRFTALFATAVSLVYLQNYRLPPTRTIYWILGCLLVLLAGNYSGSIKLIFLATSFLSLSMFIGAFFYGNRRNPKCIKLIEWAIAAWLASLFVQLAVYLASTELLDIHSYLFPHSESRLGFANQLPRLTGMHIEPGTYANWMFGLLLLSMLIRKSGGGPLFILGALSILSTLSAWGAMAGGVLLLSIGTTWTLKASWSNRARILLIVLFVLAALIAYAGYFELYSFSDATVFDYFSRRFEMRDSSGDSKLEAFEGFSHVVSQSLLIGHPLDFDYCNGCLSSQDAGIGINLSVYFGLLFTIASFSIIAIALFRTNGFGGLVTIVPLAFVKYFYYEPLFWIILMYCLLSLRHLDPSPSISVTKGRFKL